MVERAVILAIAIVAEILVAWMFALSLLVVFRRPSVPGLVEERLDTALEVELMAIAIERMANGE